MPPNSEKLTWFDAHCHLHDPRLDPFRPQVLARAAAAGVRRIHVAATSEADWPAVAALAEAHPGCILPSFGLHPWFIRDRRDGWLKALRGRLASRPSGIGEIGLDGRMDDGLDADREAVFRAQLELSGELARPASIHCRDAWGPMLEILLALPPHPAGLLIHAYSGPPDVLPALAERNIHISFGGTLTRIRNHRARRNALLVPAGRFLLESDAPDLPPELPDDAGSRLTGPDGKQLSEPAQVPAVGRLLALLRNAAPGEIAAETTAAAERLFAHLLI